MPVAHDCACLQFECLLAQRLPSSMPVLLVWGEQDHALGLGLTHALEQVAPSAQLHVLKGCSHWIQQDHVEEAHETLAGWLASTKSAESTAFGVAADGGRRATA